MSTTTFDTRVANRATIESRGSLFVWACVVVGLIFAITEHHARTSLAESFSLTVEQMQDNTSGGNLLRRLAFLSLLGGGLFLLARSAGATVFVRVGIAAPLLLAAAWAFASPLWSIDPGVTIRKVIPWVAILCAAVGIARGIRGHDFVRLVMILCGVSLVAGFLCEVALGTFRPWSAEHRFSGTMHPNTQGGYLAVLAISAFSLAQTAKKSGSPRGKLLAVIGIAFVFLLLTKSRTSFAAATLGIAAVWAVRSGTRIVSSSALVAVWMLLLVVVVVGVTGIDAGDDLRKLALMGREEQSESLTGRVPLWRELIPLAKQRPLAGYGLQTFWNEDRIADIHEQLQWPIREAHNSFLDGWLSIGIIGMGLVLLTMLVSLAVAGKRAKHDATAGFAFGLFTVVAIISCTESAMTMPMFVPFVVICCVARLAFFSPPPAADTTESAAR